MALEVPIRLPVIYRRQSGGASPCSRKQPSSPVKCRWSVLIVVEGRTFLEEVFYG
jgi:hypothetical protein